MSLSFGGLGLLSPWTPLYFWDHSVHTRPGFRSFICALVVLVVFLILAYLTNPTETSFRAYLTEQSFRQHLSHLDDLADDSAPDPDPSLSCSRPHSSTRNTTIDRATLPFHFTSRASVSLRTPKHVLHNFGICTIATTRGAAVPAGGRRASTARDHSDLDAFVSSDSWFIGALGRWWRGGLVESWYYDAMIRSKDAQGWSSGILGFKALDKFHDYEGLSFAKFTPYPRPSLRGSPPKLRNRERSTQRSGSIPHRNSSPPPLPKSASLPLHADHRLRDLLPVTTQSSHLITDQKRIVHAPPVAHTISRTSSTSGVADHSPIIAEVLRQITATQVSVHDLQNQLEEAQNTANQSRDVLEAELGELRSRRREEDQKRVDGRARIKTLEEARRLAETNKREAEKRMKAARSAKDSVMRKVEKLELEIQMLKERMDHDRAILAAEPNNTDAVEEEELLCELERKRKEVQVAEEVVVALNTHARELEENMDESKSRLRAAQHHAQLCRTFPNSADASHLGVGNGNADNSTWTSCYNPFDVFIGDVLESSTGSERDQRDTRAESRETSRSPKFAGHSSVLRAQSYAFLDDDTCHIDSTLRPGHSHNGYFNPGHATPFSPFCDPPTPSAAFIPSSLISVLDSPSVDCKGGFGISNGPYTSSPVEYTGRSLEVEHDLDLSDLHRAHGQPSRDQLSVRHNSNSYETHGSDDLQEVAKKGIEATSKELFSARKNEKHRSSLNPDAKVFRLTRLTSDKTDMFTAGAPSFDALNPTGLMSSLTSSTPSSLLRAFAPSRAEREALQRALGGSTNTSLERLPSLSDVGSIPSSPTPAHTEARGRSIGEKDCALPAWLQSLPLIRKPNFSPWEDEEQVSTEVKGK